MPHSDDQKRDAAIAWHLRLRDDGAADWDGFMAWLEEDPAHDALYQEVVNAHHDYGGLLAAARPIRSSNDNVPSSRRHLKLGAALAAAAAAGVALVGYPMLTAAPAAYAVETAVGEHKTVQLDDGTSIELNGGTRVSLRKGDARYAALDHGEATFTVTHDADHPFAVHVGDDLYQDVGTIFDITRDGDIVETAVAKGAVLYNPGGEAVRIDAGKLLTTSAHARSATLEKVDPASVATWRAGRLVYKHASIARVASDLSRNLGVEIQVSPDIAAKTFSGVVILGGDETILIPKVAALLDISIVRSAQGWRMYPRTGDIR